MGGDGRRGKQQSALRGAHLGGGILSIYVVRFVLYYVEREENGGVVVEGEQQ